MRRDRWRNARRPPPEPRCACPSRSAAARASEGDRRRWTSASAPNTHGESSTSAWPELSRRTASTTTTRATSNRRKTWNSAASASTLLVAEMMILVGGLAGFADGKNVTSVAPVSTAPCAASDRRASEPENRPGHELGEREHAACARPNSAPRDVSGRDGRSSGASPLNLAPARRCASKPACPITMVRGTAPRSRHVQYLHTMVRVADLDKSLDFYCNKFGLKEVRRVENEKGRFTLVFLAAPDDVARAAAGQGAADRTHLQLGSGGVQGRPQFRPPRLSASTTSTPFATD